MNDLNLLWLAIQDATLATQNMIIAGRSLGLGSCLLGAAPGYADKIAEQYARARQVMDEGYIAQDYYSSKKAMIKLIVEKMETYEYDTYSWTEHICRKVGQWNPDPEPMQNQLKKKGFYLNKANP